VDTLEFPGGRIKLLPNDCISISFEGWSITGRIFTVMHSLQRGQNQMNDERRRLAALAMQGFIGTHNEIAWTYAGIAKAATECADALLKELAK
jgi:hypothetical protein